MRAKLTGWGILAAVIHFAAPLEARVFFTGSNPMLSSIVFPQDNLLIPGGDNISFYTSWQSFPWWGDLDEPENKPNNQYILSGERRPELQYKASIDQFDNIVSMSRWLTNRKKLRFDLAYTSSKMSAAANGFRGESNVGYSFTGRSAIREVYLTSVLATYYKELPIGIKLGIGGVNTSRPQIEHLVLNGSETQEVLWGWNNESSNSQGEFNTGNPLKFDLQAAATFKKHKVGTRFRYYAGELDHFDFNDNSSTYAIVPMKMHNYTFRLYSIYNWYSREKFRFNTTALTRFTMHDSIKEPQGVRNIPESVARAKVFVLQVNPNVNIYPWKYPLTYIDAAILCNYQYTRYDHFDNGEYRYASPPWNTNGEGVPEYVWRLDEPSNESFSFANEHFFEVAFDMYASIPVFGRRGEMAAIGISALVWRRYKWREKYFGHMSGNEFEEFGRRQSFDKEMWLNTLVNFVYRRGSVMYRLDFGQPLIYSLTPKTELVTPEGQQVGTLGKEKMWLAQSGYKVGFFISTDLENFMKYQPLARPD